MGSTMPTLRAARLIATGQPGASAAPARDGADLEPHAIVEQFPRLEGRQMVMLLAPKKTAVTKHHPNKPEAGSAPAAKAQKASPPESTAVGSK